MVIADVKGILETSNDTDRDLEVGRGDEQGGDKDDEIGLSISRHAGRFNFEVETRCRYRLWVKGGCNVR